MRRWSLYLSALILSALVIQSANAYEKMRLTQPRPAVDVAILLDTSNSMDGLIGQAKSQLWTIVNEFAAAKKHGLTPKLRVALFEYGNTNLPAGEGYIRQVVPLTDDLDVLSEALFSLTTNGGDEYCGQVIHEAVKRLDWIDEPNAYKAIFIAGNEPFTQGQVDYKQACAYAIGHGVIVNTIHCGDFNTGVEGMWKHGALLAEGNYLNINQDRAVIHIDAPQDVELLEYNRRLNSTYLWYGKEGKVAGARQLKQDSNAASLGRGNLAKRAASKSSSVYRNPETDLIDAIKNESVQLGEVDEEDLPDVMKDMNEEERAHYVQEQTAERETIQVKIRELTVAREKHVAKERQRLAEDGDVTLGDVIVRSVREQLKDAGFEAGSQEIPEQ